MQAAGVLLNKVMSFGQMNELPGVRFGVEYAALTMAKYFRDDEQRDVLLLIDNIFRFIQAGSEGPGLIGQMSSRLGRQPTLGTEPARLEERIANTETGDITSIQTVYEPVCQRLLPLDETWRSNLAALPWPTGNLPGVALCLTISPTTSAINKSEDVDGDQ